MARSRPSSGRRASLLPAGITAATGTFEAGDPVDLTNEAGRPVARGLVNYDAKELPSLMGRSTRWLSSKLGPEYEREVVHRDDLVILWPAMRRAGPGGILPAPLTHVIGFGCPGVQLLSSPDPDPDPDPRLLLPNRSNSPEAARAPVSANPRKIPASGSSDRCHPSR